MRTHGEGEDGTPEVVEEDGPSHTLLTLGEREDLGTVHEGHGAFTDRVSDGEQVDEEGDESSGRLEVVDEEHEATNEEGDAHGREGREEQGTATKGVDGEDGGKGEHEVERTEADRCEEGLLVGEAAALEDGRRVEGCS